MALEPASFNVSTSPMRTRVENSEPSRTTASAAVAPAFMAAATTSVAVCFKFILPFYRGGAEPRRKSLHKIKTKVLRSRFPRLEKQRGPTLTQDDAFNC